MQNKKILVTGGTGMIGRELVDLLKDNNEVSTASLDREGIEGCQHYQCDLTHKDVCTNLCDKKDVIFHLAGVKGSPDAAINRPASFFVPMLQFNTNLAQAAMERNVGHFLYTSSVGVYGPAEVFKEEDTETTFPSKNDWYAGWAKRVGEMQLKAYEIQYGWKNYSIIRPANVYGKYDNFDIKNAMVVPTLIYKMIEWADKPLELFGTGENIRDLVYAMDVARAMVFMVENKVQGPCNIGSGRGITIKELVDVVAEATGFTKEIKWLGGPSGDKKRLMDMDKLIKAGFYPQTSLAAGIHKTVGWYKENRDIIHNRTNYFKEVAK